MWQAFDNLETRRASFLAFSSSHSHEGYARDEFIRFITVAGAIRATYPTPTGSGDERAVVHVLLRSLLESYFWVLYIFEKPALADRVGRFQRHTDEFQRQYAKMCNDPHLPHRTQIPPPQAGWSNLPKAPDVASILAMQQNVHGQNLGFLYFTYRVTSFDTHGRAAPEFFKHSFGAANQLFPFLQTERAIELMAADYEIIWNGGQF